MQQTPLGNQLAEGVSDELTERQATEEMIALIQNLELEGTIFRANHISNILPLEGRFPRDKERLLRDLQHLLASDALDSNGPGRRPPSL